MSSKLMLRASVATFALVAAGLAAGSAAAADLPAKAAPPVVVEEHCKAAISTPAFGPTIKAPPSPSCWASPIGDLYVGGALSGYAYNFTNPFNAALTPLNTEPDRNFRLDFTNAQLWIQKADGPFQFYAQGGLYSIPSLGLPVYRSTDQNSLLFGPVPVAYGKYVINDEWSIQGGRMFTNIGSELPFTFQNINISRGLLFNQENIINQGVQVNYASGPWSASLAVTDGFFSGSLNWVTGLITYKIDDENTIGVNGGTSFSRFDSRNRGSQFQFATFNTFQNSSIVSVNYTYASGPWTITPYIQFTNVDADARLGITTGASTFGGALLAAYSFTDWFSLGGRFEYITQDGNRLNPTGVATTVLYGPGSSAFSYTITPTFTFDRFFVRGEYSHVDLQDIQRGSLLLGTLGSGFGRTGNRTNQDRYMVEAGFTF